MYVKENMIIKVSIFILFQRFQGRKISAPSFAAASLRPARNASTPPPCAATSVTTNSLALSNGPSSMPIGGGGPSSMDSCPNTPGSTSSRVCHAQGLRLDCSGLGGDNRCDWSESGAEYSGAEFQVGSATPSNYVGGSTDNNLSSSSLLNTPVLQVLPDH